MSITNCYNYAMSFDPKKWQSFIRSAHKRYYMQAENRPSLTAFARHLGITPQVMSNWDLAKIKERPGPDLFLKLVPEYGNEVYEALDLPVPTDDISVLEAFAPPELVKSIREAREEYSAELAERNMETDSPEARQIVINAFEKRGIKVNVTN